MPIENRGVPQMGKARDFDVWWSRNCGDEGPGDSYAKRVARKAYCGGHADATADVDDGAKEDGRDDAKDQPKEHAPPECVDRLTHPELRTCPGCGLLFSTPGYIVEYTDDGWAVFAVLHPPRHIANAASKDDAIDIVKELNRLLDK